MFLSFLQCPWPLCSPSTGYYSSDVWITEAAAVQLKDRHAKHMQIFCDNVFESMLLKHAFSFVIHCLSFLCPALFLQTKDK